MTTRNAIAERAATALSERQFSFSHCTLLKIRCREPRTLVAARIADKSRDLLGGGWLASLNKQLQSIKLFAEHGFYSWRNFLEAALNKSANTVGELEAG